MAKNYMGNMTFGVDFKVDTKALDQLDTKFSNILQGITRFGYTAKGNNVLEQQAKDAKKAYDQLYDAMAKAYNSKLGQFDLSKVNTGLKEAGTSLSQVVAQLNGAGQNVNTILSSFMSNKLMIKETNQFLDKMAVTFGNTIRWSITTKLLNTITGAVQKAVYFTKDLDRSLNDIRIVTGKSADEMERFAIQATNAAQALGKTTTDYTKASLLYYQQGLSDKEVAARTETTLKAANVTGQSTAEVSEQLTAVWNGYRVTAAETEKYVDKLSAVAASTASNLEELSTGMSKVASAANMMGVDIDQLNAQLSTVISVTRQAPETIGAAFKTIYSRMSTIKAGGIDEEDGATLTSYSEKMNQFGFSVLDVNGNLRDMGEVIEEIGNKWEDLTREQQVGLAQAMGGTRQYSNLTALFENWDKYQSALQTSQNASGTLQKQQNIYMESIEAHFEQLTAEAEKFYQSLLDEDALKEIADGLKFLVQELNNFVKSIGGGGAALTAFGATVMNVFSNQIGRSIGQFQNNIRQTKAESQKIADVENLVNQVSADNPQKTFNSKGDRLIVRDMTPDAATIRESNEFGMVEMSTERLKEQANIQRQILDVRQQLGTEKYNELTQLNEEVTLLKAEEDSYQVIKEEIEASANGMSIDEIATRLDSTSEQILAKEDRKIKKQEEELDNLNAELEILEKIKKEREEIEKGTNGSQSGIPYQIDLKNSSLGIQHEILASETQKRNRYQSMDEDLLNMAQVAAKRRNATIDLGNTKSASNSAFNQQLLNIKNTLDNTKDRTAEEETALKTVNELLAKQKINLQDIEKLESNISTVRDKQSAKVQELEEKYQDVEKIVKDLQDTLERLNELAKSQDPNVSNEELQNKINEIVSQIEDKELFLNNDKSEHDKNVTAYQFKEDQDIISKGALGKSEQRQNQIKAGEAKILDEGKAADVQKKWQATTRAISGAVRAATAMVGGFSTFLDKTNDASTRASGIWTGLTGTITGTLSAVNPLLGMAAGAVTGLAKSIMDATGLTKIWGDSLKTDAEKMQDVRQAISETTDRLKTINQTISEQQSITANYNKQIKSLNEMKVVWDTINSKRAAHIELSKEEQEEYESIKQQLIDMNGDIVESYNGQYEAIINNNTALDSTLEKLQREYELQSAINNISSQERLSELNRSYRNEQKYEVARKALVESDTKTVLQSLMNLWKQGQVLDVARGGKYGITEATNVRDTATRQDLQGIINEFGAEVSEIKFFAERDIDEIIKNITEAEVDSLQEAIEVASKEASGGFIFADSDDFTEVFDWLREIAITNKNLEGKELDKEQENTIQSFIKDYAQELKKNILPADNTSLISNLAEAYGTSEYETELKKVEQGQLTDEKIQQLEEQNNKKVKKYLEYLTKSEDVLEEVYMKLNTLETEKADISIQEYLQARQKIYNLLPDELQQDDYVFENLMGGTDFISKKLQEIQDGGHVNLLLRPEIDTEELNKAGYDAGEGFATVFTHTFTNVKEGDTIEDMGEDLIAMNFTPIMVDPETGEYLGVLAPDEFAKYCEDVINGAEDKLNLQIGTGYRGSEALEWAESDAEMIHKLHEALSNTEISGDELDKYAAFVTSSKDYSSYGDDVLAQYEGFKHEEYGFKLYKDAIGDIQSSLNEIKNLSLDGSALDPEKFAELTDGLKKYKNHLADFKTEMEILTDEELYGTQIWLESLEHIEKELRKVQEQYLLNERHDIIQLELDDTKAKMQIDKLVNADYKIIADVELQSTESFDSAIKELNNIQQALDYVGEKGIVAAENIQELISAIPELADSVSVLDNGTIQLTEEQIELIQKRTDADVKGTIAAREVELTAQLQRIEQERNRIREQLALVDSYLNADKETQKARETFEKQFLEIYSKYEDAKSDISIQNDEDIAESSWDTANAVTDYWIGAYKDAANANDEFVQAVLNGQKAIEGHMNPEDWQQSYNASNNMKDRKHNLADEKDVRTGSQKILDEVSKQVEDSDMEKYYKEIKARLEAELQKANTNYALVKGYMLELSAVGSQIEKSIGGLGDSTSKAAWQAKHLYDYYHDINKELDYVNQKLTILQKKQKLLEGNGLLHNLQLQTQEYNRQLALLQQKRGIQAGYQEELQTRMVDELGNKGLAAYGIKFDDISGAITNYAEIAKALQEGQNSKESVENYQNFINQVKTYEENLKLALDLEGQLYDVVAKRQELQTKAVEEQIKINLDVSDARKKYMEFTKELGNWEVNLILNPDQTAVDAATAQVAESFVESAIDAMEKNANMTKLGQDAIGRLKAGDFDLDEHGNITDYVSLNGSQYRMEDLLKMEEDVDKFAQAASQSAGDIQQAYQNTLDAYSNAMKELNDWDKRVLARYDMINGVYDHAEKLTELWYGKDSLEAQIMLTSTQQQKTNNLYEKAKEANDQVKKDWEIYQDAVSQGNEKLAEEAYDAWAESMQNLQSLTEQFAEERKKQLQDELELAAKIVETQIYGGKTREEFTNTWELINKQAETYLDTINAQFGVTQLENKYLQAINKSVGNTKAQEKLNKIMSEEMAMLKEKDKLTKYDLERAEAKYDLTLKQIALEEARENKTNLRLRRDSQGNYTYQYAANEADVLQAQSDLDAAKNNLYNMDRDRYQELTQQAIDTEAEYYQKLSEIQTKFGDDEEARLAAESELYDAYFGDNGILTGILAERAVAYKNLNESIVDSITGSGSGTILGSFEQLATDLPAKISELAPALDESIQGIVDLWTDPETGIASAYTTLQSETEEFYKKYQADLAQFASDIDGDTTFGKIRTTFGTVKDAVDEFEKAAGLANTAIGSLNDTSSKFSLNALVTDFGTLITDLGGADDENGLIWRINEANTKLTNLVNPDEKVNNFKKITKSLASIRTTLDKNKERFDTALTEIKDWKEAVVGYAQDAETEIGKVANALDSLKDKTVKVTVNTVYAGGGGDTSGGGKDGDEDTGQSTWTTTTTTASEKTKVYVVTYSGLEAPYYFKYKDDANTAANWLKHTAGGDHDDAHSQEMTKEEVMKQDPSAQLCRFTYERNGSIAGIERKNQFVSSLDTGGYTGVWGDQGKLAMLHEKELVLNKEDTTNLLEAIDIMRKLDLGQIETRMYESFLLAQQRMAEDRVAPDTQPTAINQTITINADFPDASDRDEIRAAFDSLVNMASQRAFTKRY